jgi:arylsulfatase A-like enzyme
MSTAPPRLPEVKPNVIWFMVDQMRAQAMSLVGDPNVRTPNLDRLARDGFWFRRAVSGFPLCCPARGSFLTGLYPHRCVPGHQYPLPDGMPTLAHAFSQAGYHTAWFGKWHLDGHQEGPHPERAAWHVVPRERRGGFATWVGYENNNAQWDCWVHGHDHTGEVPMRRLPGHETDALTDMLLAEVARIRGQPFFACVSVQPPHDPYGAPAQWMERHPPAGVVLRPNVPPIPDLQEAAQRSLAGYYALIEQIDHNVGRLLDRLAELGIDDHTYIVFVSDHGDHHGSHGHDAKMSPLEESIRVPLMIWGGSRWGYQRGMAIDEPFNHVDLAPTTLGLCGIAPPESMQGFNYGRLARVGTWQERQAVLAGAPREAYLQSVVPTQHGPSVDLPWRGITTRDGWKYVALEGQPWLLYDLNRDPFELRNLAQHAHARLRRRELNEVLRGWIARSGDSFALPDFDAEGRPLRTLALQQQWPAPPGR